MAANLRLVIEKNVSLVQQVAAIAGVVWAHEISDGASECEIQNAEKVLQVRFPQELRTLVLSINGAVLLQAENADPEIILFTLEDIIKETQQMRDQHRGMARIDEMVLFARFPLTSDYPIGILSPTTDKDSTSIFEAYDPDPIDWFDNNRVADSIEELIGKAFKSIFDGYTFGMGSAGYWI